ncbi:MAG: succinate dehydrogenase, hydrophobic membrane anchor protein [Pseudomonadota bacterium]
MQRFLTDRKRATGLGSGHDGTHHHWQMMVSSMAIVVVAPIFFVTFALGLQGSYEEVVAYFSRPGIAIIMVISLVVIIRHVMHEALEAVEDYVHGVPGKLALVGVTWASYILIFVGLFAIARMAL